MLRSHAAVRRHVAPCLIAAATAFAICASSGSAWASEAPASQPVLLQDLPPGIAQLFVWPSQSLVSGEQRRRGDESREITWAKQNSIAWIKRVIRTAWLPTEADYLGDNLIMIQDEYGPLDATHVRWTHGGYQIEVAQTRSTIAIKLTPTEAGTGVGETRAAKLAYARGVCSELLNEYEDIRNINPKLEPVRAHVLPEILGASFDRGRLSETGTILHGRRDWRARRSEDAEDEVEAKEWHWDSRREAEQWWWGCLSWWTDGRVVGVYTLKASRKMWLPNDRDGVAGRWFEGEPDAQPPRPWEPPEQLERLRE